MKKVSIITVNYNQPAATEALLESIFNTNTYFSLEIIVVDNGSTENPLHPWKLKFPAVNFIRSEVNLGYAGGCNLGIREAIGDYYLIVHNDTEFTEELIDNLVETLDNHPEVGIVSPKIRYLEKPDTLQYAGYTKMNYSTATNRCIGNQVKDKGQYDKLTGPTAYVHRAAMMVRREVVRKVGEMPEIYFLYYEEMDWSEQIRNAGYTIWVNMQALIYHKSTISADNRSNVKEYLTTRNRILFIRRNCEWKVRATFWTYFIFVVAIRKIFRYLRKRQSTFLRQLFKAIYWNMSYTIYSTEMGYDVNANNPAE